MTQTLNNYQKSFSSVDDCSNDKCKIDINISHLKYDNGLEYYNIIYTYDTDNKAHPFYNMTKIGVNGTIVYKNDITESLVRYLMLSDSDLSQLTGTTTPNAYRKLIMKSLDLFWD